MATHDLKTVQPWFDAVQRGAKTAELRVDDRGIAKWDILHLREWNAESGYTGQSVRVTVTHVLRGFEGLAPGWAMFSFKLRGTP